MPSDERRRDLELAAYGQSASAEESAAARRELERLARSEAGQGGAGSTGASAAATEAERSDRGEAAGVEAPADVELEGSGQDPAPGSSSPRRTSRKILIGGVAAGLVVGLAGGALLESVLNPSVTTVVSPPAADLYPTPGSTRFDGDVGSATSAQEKIIAAETLLARPYKSDDYYYAGGRGANVTYVPSSTRLAAKTTTVRIWIAREAGTQGGYCLLSLSASTGKVPGLGLSSCALPKEFVTSGIVLSADGYDVTWVGGTVTVAAGN